MNIKIIISILALIVGLSGAIGAGLWFYFNPINTTPAFEFSADEQDKVRKETKPRGAVTAEADLKEEQAKRQAALLLFLEYPYFRLPMLNIPVIRNGQPHSFIYLRLAMKATNYKAFTKAKILLPRLVDAIYSDLYKAFENLWDARSDPTALVIKERVFAMTDQILGQHVINEIYVREMFFKRLDD